MAILPELARPLIPPFAPAFTRPTFHRFAHPHGRRHPDHRPPHRRQPAAHPRRPGPRPPLQLPPRPLPAALVHLDAGPRPGRHSSSAAWAAGPVTLAGDDTVDEHPGEKVYGKGRHRDPVRSTNSYTAWRWGHKWVVLAVLVRFPFATRPWALPVLVALYRPEWDREHARRHKTPARLLRQLTAVLLRWFPGRRFVLAGDGGYGSHEMARFAHRHRRRLTLVSKFHPDANLYEPPPVLAARGRPPAQEGAKLPTPEAVGRRRRAARRWRSPGTAAAGATWRWSRGIGHWYKSGEGLVPVRWVFVHDLTGTHRDEYFFTTDPAMTPQALIEAYTGRWNIETTFQEMRAYLGLETTRGRTEATVLRAAPCLFGLYTVVALLYEQLPGAGVVPRRRWIGRARRRRRSPTPSRR